MKPCPKCLTDGISETEYFKSLYEYIEQLDPEIKTSDTEYKRRLEICSGCRNMINRMCKICGCFVEARAAKKSSRCPSGEKNW